ncbi:MAG: protein kinase [Candidatus Berkiella sp.]
MARKIHGEKKNKKDGVFKRVAKKMGIGSQSDKENIEPAIDPNIPPIVESEEENVFKQEERIKGDKKGTKTNAPVRLAEEREPLTLQRQLKQDNKSKLKPVKDRELAEAPKKQVDRTAIGANALQEQMKLLKKREGNVERAEDVSAINQKAERSALLKKIQDLSVSREDFVSENRTLKNYAESIRKLSISFDVDNKVKNREEIIQTCFVKVKDIKQQMDSFLRSIQSGEIPDKSDITQMKKGDIPEAEVDLSRTSMKGNEKFYASQFNGAIRTGIVQAVNTYLMSIQQIQETLLKGLSEGLISIEEAEHYATQLIDHHQKEMQSFLKDNAYYDPSAQFAEQEAVEEEIQDQADPEYDVSADLDSILSEPQSDKSEVTVKLDTILQFDFDSGPFYELQGAFNKEYTQDFNHQEIEHSIKERIQNANLKMQDHIKALQTGGNPVQVVIAELTVESLPEIKFNMQRPVPPSVLRSMQNTCREEIKKGVLFDANAFLRQMSEFQSVLAKAIQDKQLTADEVDAYLDRFSRQLNTSLAAELTIGNVDDLLADLDAYVATGIEDEAFEEGLLTEEENFEFKQKILNELDNISEEEYARFTSLIDQVDPSLSEAEKLRTVMEQWDEEPAYADEDVFIPEAEEPELTLEERMARLEALAAELDLELEPELEPELESGLDFYENEASFVGTQDVMTEDTKESLFNFIKSSLRAITTLNYDSVHNPVEMLNGFLTGSNAIDESAIEDYLAHNQEVIHKYQDFCMHLNFLQQALDMYHEAYSDDGYITEALDLINKINPVGGWDVVDQTQFFKQVFMQRDLLWESDDFRRLEELVKDIADYYKPEARRQEKESETPFEEIEVSQEAWEKAKQYFLDNPTSIKCDKYENGLSHSFLNIEGNLFAVHTGPYVGKGAFGKVKLIKDESNNIFAVKIQGDGDSAEKDAEHNIMRIVGELIGKGEREYGKTFQTSGRYAEKKFYTAKQFLPGQELYKELNPMDFTKDLDPSLFTDYKPFFTQPISEAIRLEIAIKAMQSIHSVHEKGIIHADIKPENFIINVDGEMITVSATDYGLSKVLPQGTDFIIDPAVRGTPGYIAPEIATEQRNGNGEVIGYTESEGKYSFASDVYALGVMLRDDLALSEEIYEPLLQVDPEKRPSIAEVTQILEEKLAAIKAAEIEPISPISEVEAISEEQEDVPFEENETRFDRDVVATEKYKSKIKLFIQDWARNLVRNDAAVLQEIKEKNLNQEQQEEVFAFLQKDTAARIKEQWNDIIQKAKEGFYPEEQNKIFLSVVALHEKDLIDRILNPISSSVEHAVLELVDYLYNEKFVSANNEFFELMKEILDEERWLEIGRAALKIPENEIQSEEEERYIVAQFLKIKCTAAQINEMLEEIVENIEDAENIDAKLLSLDIGLLDSLETMSIYRKLEILSQMEEQREEQSASLDETNELQQDEDSSLETLFEVRRSSPTLEHKPIADEGLDELEDGMPTFSPQIQGSIDSRPEIKITADLGLEPMDDEYMPSAQAQNTAEEKEDKEKDKDKEEKKKTSRKGVEDIISSKRRSMPDLSSTKQTEKARPQSDSALISSLTDGSRKKPPLHFSTLSSAPKIKDAEVIFTVHSRPKPEVKVDEQLSDDVRPEIKISASSKPVSKSQKTETSALSSSDGVKVQKVFSQNAPKSEFPEAFVEKIYQLHPATDWKIEHLDTKTMDIISKNEPAQRCHIQMQNEDVKFEANGKGVGDMLNCVQAYQESVAKDFDLTYDLAVRTEEKAVEVLQQLMNKGINKEQISSVEVAGKQLSTKDMERLLENAVVTVDKSKRQGM